MPRMTTMLAGLWLLAGTMPMSTAAAQAAEQARHVHVVVIDKMQFGPMPAGVRAGDVIEWTNHDILEHSATARDGRFDIDLKPGQSVRTTAVAGTFALFCKFHPTMTATLVVR